MAKYVVLNGTVLEARLKFATLEAAAARAQHEVQLKGGSTFYVAELITAFSGEVVSRETPIGDDSQESC